MHKGVGVAITDERQRWFYLNQKCGPYPVEEYKDGFSFFGGRMEPGETPEMTLERELGEELGEDIARIIFPAAAKVKRFEISVRGTTYEFTLYESIQPRDQVIALANAEVLEEGVGVLVPRRNVGRLNYIWGLERAMQHYLGRIQSLSTR